jgi:hypothetical protein
MFNRVQVAAMLFAVLLASVVNAETTRHISKPPQVTKEHRSLSAIRLDVSAALKAEATTRRSGSNAPEVLRLVELFREMAAHSDRDTSAVLKKLGQQVRSRLMTVRDRIERQIARENRSKRNLTPPHSAAAQETHVLAQQLPPAGAQGGQAIAVTGIPSAGATAADYGPDLVELIQATISPESWNINGGINAVVYYAPLRVLVVSAPSEIHEQVGGVLRQLNAAQRKRDGAQVTTEVAAVRVQ